MNPIMVFLYGIFIGAVTVGGLVFLLLMLRQKRRRASSLPLSPLFPSRSSTQTTPQPVSPTFAFADPPSADAEMIFVRGNFNTPRTAQQQRAWDRLPPRQKEAAILIGEGKTTREVADAMCIEMSTVRGYLKEIYAALGMRSRAELALFVRDMALVDSPPPQHTDTPN